MSKTLNIFLSILVILLLFYIIYDKLISDSDESKEHIIDNRDNSDVRYYSFVSDNVSKSVYLFKDKTYYYSFTFDGVCNNWSKGTYDISNNILSLKEEVYAGCDSCYYTNSNKVFKFNYGNNIIISNDREYLSLGDVDILPITDIELIDGIRNCTQ